MMLLLLMPAFGFELELELKKRDQKILSQAHERYLAPAEGQERIANLEEVIATLVDLSSTRDPALKEPVVALGECYLAAGEPRSALLWFGRARRLGAEVRRSMVAAWLEADDPASAIPVLSELASEATGTQKIEDLLLLASLEPDRASALEEAAIASWETAGEPPVAGLAPIFTARARALAETGDIRLARSTYERALQLTDQTDSRQIPALLGIAHLYLSTGQPLQSLPWLERARALLEQTEDRTALKEALLLEAEARDAALVGGADALRGRAASL